MHNQKVSKLGSGISHMLKSDCDGVYNWPRKWKKTRGSHLTDVPAVEQRCSYCNKFLFYAYYCLPPRPDFVSAVVVGPLVDGKYDNRTIY